jgi:hypothetical protein
MMRGKERKSGEEEEGELKHASLAKYWETLFFPTDVNEGKDEEEGLGLYRLLSLSHSSSSLFSSTPLSF